MSAKLFRITSTVKVKFDNAKAMQAECRSRVRTDPESALAWARGSDRKMQEALEAAAFDAESSGAAPLPDPSP
jgi:hypothetical protein